ncbi:hypothetical protein [Chryseobacterium indoltheticum]|uniref:hypothetical protein n=1 Tax=Chryseobacterium indoltheticum TaxID=254 RepID=UPI003F499CE4
MLRVWNIARNSGATITFYASEEILNILQRIIKKANIDAEFIIMNNWKDGEQTATQLKDNEGLIILMAKREWNHTFRKCDLSLSFLISI